MRDAESRFADSTHCAGSGRHPMSGVSSKRAASTGGDGSGAPSGRLLPGVLVAVLGLLILALGASSASAALRHTTISGVFGNDGTNGTSWNGRASAWSKTESQFYGIGPEDLRIIGVPAIGSYTFVNPPNGATLDGGYVGNSAEADVDNSGGPRDGDLYIATESKQLRGLDSIGRIAPELPDSVRRQHLRRLGRQRRLRLGGRTRPPNRW